MSFWEKFEHVLWAVEEYLVTKTVLVLNCLTWIKVVEVPTRLFTLAIFLLVGAFVLYLKVRHFDASVLEGLEKPAEILSTGLNFLGVIFIANGVILSRSKKQELLDLLFFPAPFRKAVRKALLEASNSCEKGMLIVIVGFIIDLVSKFAFSPAAHCIK